MEPCAGVRRASRSAGAPIDNKSHELCFIVRESCLSRYLFVRAQIVAHAGAAATVTAAGLSGMRSKVLGALPQRYETCVLSTLHH